MPGPERDTPARRRLADLPAEASRDDWFGALREILAELYLSEPGNVYLQNGRSSGAARWQETRRCIADAVHRDGDFLDVGCANGLLLESLIGWCGERGIRLRPHGIDFVAPLIALARERHPEHAASFEVANVWYWQPRRRYDFVRTNLEYVREPDWPEFVARQLPMVAPGGRLIVCHYHGNQQPDREVAAVLASLGYEIVGSSGAPGVSLAWLDPPA